MKGLNRYFLVIGLVAWLSMFMAEAAPDLFVSEFSLNPETPVQGSPVTVRLGVYNQGTGSSGPFSVQ
ncbi:MAG: hypothetical protein KBB04_02945, partial [Methanothrix sp.]|nr:hypothetical protein [Methanothrix sp.]